MKYRPYSRRVFRNRFTDWAGRNAKLLTLLSLAWAALGIALTLLLTWGSTSAFGWYLLGVLHAVLICAYAQMMHLAYLASDREAIAHLRGAWGEENTRSELQRAKRRRLVWGWVDSISLQIGDLDHFAVTRRAGLMAIDSKWRNSVTREELGEMARGAQRMQLRAEAVVRSRWASEGRSRHRARTNPLAVRPVVVLWGAAQHDVPDNAVVDGVEFVAGSKLVRWLKQLDGEPVSRGAGDHAVQLLTRFRAEAWEAATRRDR